MPLNEPVIAHWLDLDLLPRLGVAAVIGLIVLTLLRLVEPHDEGRKLDEPQQ